MEALRPPNPPGAQEHRIDNMHDVGLKACQAPSEIWGREEHAQLRIQRQWQAGRTEDGRARIVARPPLRTQDDGGVLAPFEVLEEHGQGACHAIQLRQKVLRHEGYAHGAPRSLLENDRATRLLSVSQRGVKASCAGGCREPSG